MFSVLPSKDDRIFFGLICHENTATHYLDTSLSIKQCHTLIILYSSCLLPNRLLTLFLTDQLHWTKSLNKFHQKRNSFGSILVKICPIFLNHNSLSSEYLNLIPFHMMHTGHVVRKESFFRVTKYHHLFIIQNLKHLIKYHFIQQLNEKSQ